MFQIRRIEEADILEVYSIDCESFGPETYPIIFFRQSYELYPETFFVASYKSKVIGYSLGTQVASNRRIGWIISLAVLSDYQRQNIGSSLLASTMSSLRKAGCTELLLSVHPENKKAKALFEKQGFRFVYAESDYAGPGNPRDIMQVILD